MLPRGTTPLPVGTFGRICFLSQPSGEVQARARFRDYDGRTRPVSITAGTRAAAEQALKRELSTRLASGDRGAVTAGTRLADLADAWLEARVVDRKALAAAASSGPGAARTARACLSGMLTMAVEDGAIGANPARDARPRIGSAGGPAGQGAAIAFAASLANTWVADVALTRARQEPAGPRATSLVGAGRVSR